MSQFVNWPRYLSHPDLCYELIVFLILSGVIFNKLLTVMNSVVCVSGIQVAPNLNAMNG